MPKILCDYHHEELYESLRILFEDRLGMEMYRPIGVEWYTEGFWKVYDHPSTVQQYLGLSMGEDLRKKIEENPTHHHSWLNIGASQIRDGMYVIPNIYSEKQNKAITLEAFKEMDFDIIISSIPVHVPMHRELINRYAPRAKHIFQAGNNWGVDVIQGVRNFLNSTTTMTPPSGINHVRYHQEFSLERWKRIPKSNPKSITSMTHYMQEPELFFELEQLLPDWTFRSYGAGNRDGAPRDLEHLAEVTRESGFLWHLKREGDGYGYNIFHAVACGSPVITCHEYFNGMTAFPMIQEGINISGLSAEAIADLLRRTVENYQEISDRTYSAFTREVDFNKEETTIRHFMEKLI